MTLSEALLTVILLLGIAALTVSVYALRSSRRSEELGEDRYELLRDQDDRLTFLREERKMLVEELERESQERHQLMESLKGADPQLVEDLKQERQRNLEENAHRLEQEQERLLRLERELHQLEEELEQERQAHAESERKAEQQEQERLRLEQELQRLEEELKQESDERSRIQREEEGAAHGLQQLRVDLEREREKRQEAQRGTEKLEQELLRLEQELSRSKGGSGSGQPWARPWWRRPIPVVALLLGALIVWLTSLVVALNILNL